MKDVIEDIPSTMEKFLGFSGKMVKPSSETVLKILAQIPKGKVTTIAEIRAKLAHDFNVQTACPAATLKSIIQVAKSKESIAYWRVLKPKGELIAKLPGGFEKQSQDLEMEGFEIDNSKKTPTVIDFSSRLEKFD